MKVIRCVGLANGAPTRDAGALLMSFDPDGHAGRGDVVWTRDPTRALQFPGMAEAWAYWTRQSTVLPTRPDGKPNRPMTAYHVGIEDV